MSQMKITGMARLTLVVLECIVLVLVGSATCQKMSSSEVELATMAPVRTSSTVKKALGEGEQLWVTESPIGDSLFDSSGLIPEGPPQPVEMSELLPQTGSLFDKDAVDTKALVQMDCHLRNIDYCYAGIMGSASKALPETDAQLETRCDEMKAATSCMALFNQRCQTFKVFAALAPLSSLDRLPVELRETRLPAIAQGAAMGAQLDEPASIQKEFQMNQIKMTDLMSICEPDAKQNKMNKILRQRLFSIAKCVNQRIPLLAPCIEDLKTALQLFYEPRRSLPVKPSCCAMSRFRQCAVKTLDNICGLSSFDQLEATLSSGAGSMLKTVERVCKQGADFNSPYCAEVLPPSGMKAPQRRGSKASKLAKALDLISFAPAAQAD